MTLSIPTWTTAISYSVSVVCVVLLIWLFLDERIGWHTLAGAALVLTGTALVTGLRLRSLLRKTAPSAESGQA